MRYPDSYAVFDFETTGLDTRFCEVTEIGLKVVSRLGPRHRSWLLKTQLPIPAEITILTGITQEMIDRDGVHPSIAFGEFWQEAKHYPLIGHNCLRYDFAILERYLKLFNLPFGRHRERAIDTAALFKAHALGETPFWYEGHYEFACRVLEIRSYQKFNLTYACQQLGIDVTDMGALHRAGADVEACDRVFRKFKESN